MSTMPILNYMRLGFSSLVMILCGWAFLESRGFPTQAAIFPMIIAGFGTLLAAATLVVDALRWRRSGSALGGGTSATASTAAYEPGTPQGYVFARAGRYGLWILGYLLTMFVFGVVVAAAIFVTAFLMIESSVKWRYVWIAPIAILALLFTLENAVNLFWPESLFSILL